MSNRPASRRWPSKTALAVALAATATLLAFEPWQWWTDDPRMPATGPLKEAGADPTGTPAPPAAVSASGPAVAALPARRVAAGKAPRREATRAGPDVAALALEPTGAIHEAGAQTDGAAAPQSAQDDPQRHAAPAVGTADEAQACCPASAAPALNGLLPPLAMLAAACAVTQQMLQTVH